MSEENNSTTKLTLSAIISIVVALITVGGSLIAALIQAIANPDWIVLLQKNQIPTVTFTAIATTIISPTFPAITQTPTTFSTPTSAFSTECPETEIYFKFSLSTGVDQIKCPNGQNVIDLTDTEIQGLGILSGQAISSEFTNETTCRWKWNTNENITWQEFQSPKGVCSFSTGLTQTTKKVFLQLISDPNQPFFMINLQR